jgi:hypothetical protein
MTSNYEDFRHLPVKKDIKIKTHKERYLVKIQIDKYTIKFDKNVYCCEIPGILIMRNGKTTDLKINKSYDIGYVNNIFLTYGDTYINLTNKKCLGKIINENNITNNVFKLHLNHSDTELYFYNGNNEEGYYSHDFMIYEDDKLLFKSSL